LAATAPTPGLKEEVEAQLRESQSFTGRRREIEAYNEAVKMANAGDFDGAARRLEEMLKGSPGPKAAGEARDLLAEVRAVSLYNGAVEKARAKDYRGALALLDRMPSEVKDHPVVEAAATLRKQVKAAMSQAPAR
jgi:TolA-binding protein